MTAPALDWRGDVALVDLGDGENRFARGFLAALDAALDAVLARQEATALVTFASGRFYCNGYDLGWLAEQALAERRAFIRDQQRLLARLLVFPLPTFAAIGGHAFGAGALLALAHDVRLVAAERADVCLPEIDARIPLRRAMWAMLETRLSPAPLRDVALSGARFGGAAAVSAGLAQRSVEPDKVVAAALELASRAGRRDRLTLAGLKAALYAEAEAGLVGERRRESRGEAAPG